jgi:isoamylase
MINAYWEDLAFAIQEGQSGDWMRVVDTSRPSPDDIADPGSEPWLGSLEYRLPARSVAVLYRNSVGAAPAFPAA